MRRWLHEQSVQPCLRPIAERQAGDGRLPQKAFANRRSVAVYTRHGDLRSLSSRRQPTLTRFQWSREATGFSRWSIHSSLGPALGADLAYVQRKTSRHRFGRGLVVRLRGHYNYYGLRYNSKALGRFHFWVTRAWHKWLNRRGDRRGMPWARFQRLLLRYPLPAPVLARA